MAHESEKAQDRQPHAVVGEKQLSVLWRVEDPDEVPDEVAIHLGHDGQRKWSVQERSVVAGEKSAAKPGKESAREVRRVGLDNPLQVLEAHLAQVEASGGDGQRWHPVRRRFMRAPSSCAPSTYYLT